MAYQPGKAAQYLPRYQLPGFPPKKVAILAEALAVPSFPAFFDEMSPRERRYSMVDTPMNAMPKVKCINILGAFPARSAGNRAFRGSAVASAPALSDLKVRRAGSAIAPAGRHPSNPLRVSALRIFFPKRLSQNFSFWEMLQNSNFGPLKTAPRFPHV
jgi:hypothetical protein